MEAEDYLEKGIAHYHNKDTERARQYVVKAIQADHTNEKAWLWLSGLVSAIQEQRYCFQYVLELNPDNFAAKKGLTRLGNGPAHRPRTIVEPNEQQPLNSKPLNDYMLAGLTIVEPNEQQSISPRSISLQEVAALAYQLSVNERADLISMLAHSLITHR